MSMIIVYLNIIKEFFKIGLLSFGGGYATLPFLCDLTRHYNWYTMDELSQMIAVATITPGPVGINVATYAGMRAGGVFTAFAATFAEILPALIIGIIVAKFLKKYSENFYIKSALWALKPVGCALLTYVIIKLFIQNVWTSKHFFESMFLFAALFLISIFKSKSPLWYISISAIIGLVFVKLSLI